jgi:hypothetical protein
MITYEELHTQNHEITELSNVLLYLFKDRSMCDNGACCELFHRYMDKVKEHIELVDRNLIGKLLTHDDHDIQKLVKNFMSGSHQIKRIMSEYTRHWCPTKTKPTLAVSAHEDFLSDTEMMFHLILERILNETEKLYPLIREISDDKQHAA